MLGKENERSCRKRLKLIVGTQCCPFLVFVILLPFDPLTIDSEVTHLRVIEVNDFIDHFVIRSFI